jgi:hypothetical protein
MTTFTAHCKPFNLLIVCIISIVSLTALAAGLGPAQAAELNMPAAQAVPAAPTAAFGLRPEAAPTVLRTVPQPAQGPAAPGVPLAGAASGSATTAISLPVMVLAVAGGLLVAGTIALRQTVPAHQPVVC